MCDVVNLAIEACDGTMQTPKMCLEECLKSDIGKRGAFKDGKKLFVVALDDSDGGYNVSWCQAGMNMSEILALIEILKGLAKEAMGY